MGRRGRESLKWGMALVPGQNCNGLILGHLGIIRSWHEICFLRGGMKDRRHVSERTSFGRWTMGLALVVAAVAAHRAVAQPELSVTPDAGFARVGRAFRVVCEASWTGSPDAYAICPAEVDAIDWGIANAGQMRGFFRDGRYIVSQTVEFVADKPGTYKAPEIRIPFLHPEATPPAETAGSSADPSAPSVPPSLRADPFDIVVRRDRFIAWVSGGLGASLFLGGAGAWWTLRRRRTKRSGGAPAEPADLRTVSDLLHTARQRRLDGQFYEYYRALARAAAIAAPELAQALQARAEAAGYRGMRPADDEMDGDMRAIERALSQRKEAVGP